MALALLAATSVDAGVLLSAARDKGGQATRLFELLGQSARHWPHAASDIRSLRLPGTRVFIRKEGTRLIIEPQTKSDLVEVLRALSPIEADNDFPIDGDATLVPLKSIDL